MRRGSSAGVIGTERLWHSVHIWGDGGQSLATVRDRLSRLRSCLGMCSPGSPREAQPSTRSPHRACISTGAPADAFEECPELWRARPAASCAFRGPARGAAGPHAGRPPSLFHSHERGHSFSHHGIRKLGSPTPLPPVLGQPHKTPSVVSAI